MFTKIYRLGSITICGIPLDIDKKFSNGRRFKVVVYRAVNVLGLIDTTQNGIAVMDLDNNNVVLTHHCVCEAGTCITVEHTMEFQKIVAMNWNSFRKFVNEHQYSRYEYDRIGNVLKEKEPPYGD